MVPSAGMKSCRPTCTAIYTTSTRQAQATTCPQTTHWAAAGCAAAGVLLLTAPLDPGAAAAATSAEFANQQQQLLPQVAPCKPKTSCVSTASFMSPSQYLPPWSFQPDSRAAAVRTLRRALGDAGATISREAAGEDFTTLEAELPVRGKADIDVVVFKLRDDGVALFSSRSTVNRPDPPFCLAKGCISGPAERGRMEALRDALGWTVLEAEGGEDARWVQILLH